MAYADGRVEDFSLAYLYIRALSFSAIPTHSAGHLHFCWQRVPRDTFGQPIHHIPGRILHNLSAFVGKIASSSWSESIPAEALAKFAVNSTELSLIFTQRDSLDEDLTVMVLQLKDNPGCDCAMQFFD